MPMQIATTPSTTIAAATTKAAAIPVRRIILLALGVGGEQVAQAWLDQILSASQRWFATANPPMRGLAVDLATRAVNLNGGENDEVVNKLAQAALELAEMDYAQELARAGIRFQVANQMDLWLIIDLTSEGSDTPVQHSASPAQIARVKDWIERTVSRIYTQIRVHITPHLLLISEPFAQAAAAQWQDALANHCPEPAYLAGPINQGYLHNSNWRQHAATALTILLWSELDADVSYALPVQPGQWVRALGGAAWLSPRRLLCQWLSLQWTLDWCDHLQHAQLPAMRDSPAGNPALGIKPPRAAWQELTVVVPPPAQEYRWMARYPAPSLLHQLSQRLQNQVETDARQRLIAQSESRRQWIKTHLAHWQNALAQQMQRWLQPAQGLPELARARTELQLVLANLATARQEAGELLAAAEAQLLQSSDAAKQTLAALQGACDQFPPATSAGLVQAVLKPWRWAAWAHLYVTEVETLTRRALSWLAARGQAAWQRANLLVLCELYDVMIQIASAPFAKVEQLWATVSEAKALVAAQMIAIDDTELQPWTATKLQQLYAQYFGDGYLLARQFYQEVWNLHVDKWTAAELLQATSVWAMPRAQPVAEWSAIETLSAALPSAEELATWSQAWLNRAAPLWPHEELLAGDESASWVFGLPARTDEEPVEEKISGWVDSLAGQIVRIPLDSRTQYQYECEAQLRAQMAVERVPLWGATPVDGLLCLRWMPINLSARYDK